MAEFLSQSIILLNKAKTDFMAAKLLHANFISGNGEIDIEIVCFHLQQCAEKSLKSILSEKSIDFPRVHDLELLLNLVDQSKIEIPVDRDLLIELNDFAIEGRYSVLHDDLISAVDYFSEVEDLLNQATLIVTPSP
jgi:HEPN domain-containing protein